jgi:hypothetical protein
MIEDQPDIISIDWKSAGNDYLGLFQTRYGDLAFLHSTEFDALMDELAFAIPETVFDGLSAFLAGHGFQLWNVNTLDDNYNLYIVADQDAPKRKKSVLKELVGEVYAGAFVERLAPESAREALAEKQSKTRQSKKKKLPPITKDSEQLVDGHLQPFGNSARFVMSFYNDANILERVVVDAGTWPLQDVAASGFLAATQTMDCRVLYGSDKVTFIAVSEGHKHEQICAVCDFETPTLDTWGNEPTSPSRLASCVGFGDRLFYISRGVSAKRKHRNWAEMDAEERNQRAALMMMSGGQTVELAKLEKVPMLMIALSERQLVAFYGHHDTADHFAIFDVDTGEFGPDVALISPAMQSVVRLNADEFVYCTTNSQPHDTYPAMEVKTGFLCRVNCRTGEQRSAKLDGLCNAYTWDAAILRTQAPDKHKILCFHGFLELKKGHEDWVVLNYLSDFPGPTAVAWLWNSTTDEIVKITGQDFPREEPKLFYNQYLGCYMADHAYRLDLMVPFEEIYATRPKGRIEWG